LSINLYEAMFVVDSAKGGSKFSDTIRHIAGLLTRHGAEIERMEKWDERKLAYPIKHVRRGIYVLVYFRIDGSAIAELRHMVDLSEEVLRVLILCAEVQNPPKGDLYSPEGQLLGREPEAAPVEEAPKEQDQEPEAEPAGEADQEQGEEEGEAKPAQVEGDA